jgi:GGDEF domain-containing protein
VVAAWTELPPSGGLPECTALVELADRLRWSAPELVVQYAQHALVKGAGTASPLAVRAQAFVGAALVRLGRYAEAVEPALAALRYADQAGLADLVPSIRLDLAVSSRGLGEPHLGCVILRPVLENADARPASRAIAVAALVGCAEHVGRRDDLEDSLAEAERLLAADEALTPDARRMERALLAAQTAAYHRRYGETEDAIDAARGGLGLLAKLRDPALEGGRATARLTLELVCALLDDGELAEAARAAEGLLGQPVRAAAADPIGRTLLALANRVHVPAGRVERGRGLLGDASWIGERHGLDWLVADALTAIAHLEEISGQPADALGSLRSARAAEYRQQRLTDAARRLLMTEFGVVGLGVDAMNSLLRGVVRAQVGIGPLTKEALPRVGPRQPQELAETDAATGLLNREGLSRRLQAVRSGNRPVALTLVRLDPVESTGRSAGDHDNRAGAVASGVGPDDALTTLAGRVRDIAPADAELARSDGSELAVLMPHTTRDEAEEFAATIRESAVESDWLAEASRHEVSISTGVAQSGPDSATEDADSLLTAARETLILAEWDRPGPSPPQGSAPTAATGHQEIRDLLAPLLGHPSLTRTHPGPSHHPDPVAPESPTISPHPHPHQPADSAGSAPEFISTLLGDSRSHPERVRDSVEPESPRQPHTSHDLLPHRLADSAGSASESVSTLFGDSRSHPERVPDSAEPERPPQPHTLAGPHPHPDNDPNPLSQHETPQQSGNANPDGPESISSLLGHTRPPRPPSGDEAGSDDRASYGPGISQPPDGGSEQAESVSSLLGRAWWSGSEAAAELGSSDESSRESWVSQVSDGGGFEEPESTSSLLDRAQLTGPRLGAVGEPGLGDDSSRRSGVRQGSDSVSTDAGMSGGVDSRSSAGPDSMSSLLGHTSLSRTWADDAHDADDAGLSEKHDSELSAADEGAGLSVGDEGARTRAGGSAGGSMSAMFGRPSSVEGLGDSIAEVFGRGLSGGAEQTIPRVPEEEPEIVVPEKPDSVPPVPPGHEPTPEVPPPGDVPIEPEAPRPGEPDGTAARVSGESWPAGRVSAESGVDPGKVSGESAAAGRWSAESGLPAAMGPGELGVTAARDSAEPEVTAGRVLGESAAPAGRGPAESDAPVGRDSGESDAPVGRDSGESEGLGPVEGPEPRPRDGVGRVSLRRERSDATSIAELLTEALVAYQEAAPEQEASGVPEEVSENLPPARRMQTGGTGRHRMPDWDSV